MSQLKGKSLVNGGVVVFSDSESYEGGLWVNEVRDILAVTAPRGQEIGRRGWKRDLRPPPGRIWSFIYRKACILAGRQKGEKNTKPQSSFTISNYVWNGLCVMLRKFKVEERSLWE